MEVSVALVPEPPPPGPSKVDIAVEPAAAEVVVERDGFFFGGLLALAKALEVSFECPGFFLKGILALDGDGKRLVRSFLFRRVFTQFSLKDQRATGFFAASGKEAAGVALAVRQEEVFVGVGFG